MKAGAPDQAKAWDTYWRVDKYANDADYAAGRTYESIEFTGNLLVNTGIALLLDLLIGAGGTSYANSNARLGVGDSNTAAAAGQTDLQAATNKLRKIVDGGYPTRSAQTVTWVATFTGAEANFAWEEAGVFNAAAAGTMLNRKTQSMGTKGSGTTWVLTATVTIS